MKTSVKRKNIDRRIPKPVTTKCAEQEKQSEAIYYPAIQVLFSIPFVKDFVKKMYASTTYGSPTD